MPAVAVRDGVAVAVGGGGSGTPGRDQVRIEVRDHGPGFPPGFLPHALDRFTQADRSRATSGTGLGLAVTAAIARAADGEYGAYDHPERGAVVRIALPALPQPPESF
ncbi:ATP-binding protein [Streptomyces sp. NPDC058464]|uniref:ATP-binding protein n=1 Tax=Streptomyces sp. NPDC058464 TaxID=3346511 RepID=UPI003668D6D8